jgi:ribonuclease VapC
MKIYVLDANAVIRLLLNSAGAERIARLVETAAKGESSLVMSVINWGEALYTIGRSVGLERATADLKTLSPAIEIVIVDEALTESAAQIRLHYKLGYADCFAAALALRRGATLVTADPDFLKLGKRLKILALPRHSA